jgi:hypothetical protein
MSNYNLERGQELYFDQLSKYGKKYPDISEDIMNLGTLFANNVGVMREGVDKKDFVFDEETNLLSYSWTPSYKYLARRVADTAYVNFNSETKLSTREMIERVFTNEKFTINYEFTIESNENNKSEFRNENVIAEETNNISKQAEQFHNFTYETMAVEKDGVIINVEVPVDEIDLIDDFEYDDLSDEGKRSVGIIDLDYDTTQGHSPNILQKDKMLVGKLEMVKKTRFSEDNEISYDDYQITCPYTGSTDVYQISSNIYASYETDQPFKVDFNLPDLTPVD